MACIVLHNSLVAAHKLSSCGIQASECADFVVVVCRLRLLCGFWDLSSLTKA